MTLYVVIGLLVVLPFVFGFFIKQKAPSSKSAWILGLFMALVCVAVYATSLYNSQRVDWYDQREKLLPEVQAFLDSNSASDTLKALDGAHFVSALQYYAQQYPQDSRVWQKLAVIMVNLNMPEEGLQAIRRYLVLEPNQLEALQLEIQLLGELVDRGDIADRQLWFALDHLAASDTLLPQDSFYLAGIARQHEFFDLAILFWKKVIQADNRADNQLSEKALQGRLLLQRMIVEAEQQQAIKGNTAFLMNEKESKQSKDSSDASAAATPSIELVIQFKPDIIQKLNSYFSQGNTKAHVWVSLKPSASGQPPYAAQLVWIDADTLSSTSPELRIELGVADLIRPQHGWQKDESVRVSTSLHFSAAKSDPMAQDDSSLRSEKSFTVSDEIKMEVGNSLH